MAIFNLESSNIIDLQLKLEGKLPIDRDELLALINSWGRNEWFYTKDKDGNQIKINSCEENEKYELFKLDISKIKDLDAIFKNSYFNKDISSWDVSNVTSMKVMFTGAKEFNQPLDNWNIYNVTNLYGMFYGAEKFNQPLNSWNTLKVTSISYMFGYTKEFNQSLDKWDISNVNDIKGIFTYTKSFNQNINLWNISKVTNMDFMFEGAKVFNQPILWNLSNIKSCRNMFYSAKTFINRFNNGKELPYEIDEIKSWLIDNRNKMIALEIEDNKNKELDDFLLNINNENIIKI